MKNLSLWTQSHLLLFCLTLSACANNGTPAAPGTWSLPQSMPVKYTAESDQSREFQFCDLINGVWQCDVYSQTNSAPNCPNLPFSAFEISRSSIIYGAAADFGVAPESQPNVPKSNYSSGQAQLTIKAPTGSIISSFSFAGSGGNVDVDIYPYSLGTVVVNISGSVANCAVLFRGPK